MFRTLLSMLKDESIRTQVMDATDSLRKAYSNVMYNLNSTFEEEDNNYVYVLNVPESLTTNDVNVEYDDETRLVTVEITNKVGNSTYSMTNVEMLPINADPDTMSATVVNGVFTLIVEKMPEVEPEVEPEVGPIKVTIKRKNK